MEMNEENVEYLSLTDADGCEVIFEVLCRTEVSGVKYVALLSAEFDSDEVVILRDNGNGDLCGINDPKELQIVYEKVVAAVEG